MSKQAKQRKQKRRQLGGLDASVVVGEATNTTGLYGDQLLACYYLQQSHIIVLFTNSFSETKSHISSRKLY